MAVQTTRVEGRGILVGLRVSCRGVTADPSIRAGRWRFSRPMRNLGLLWEWKTRAGTNAGSNAVSLSDAAVSMEKARRVLTSAVGMYRSLGTPAGARRARDWRGMAVIETCTVNETSTIRRYLGETRRRP